MWSAESRMSLRLVFPDSPPWSLAFKRVPYSKLAVLSKIPFVFWASFNPCRIASVVVFDHPMMRGLRLSCKSLTDSSNAELRVTGCCLPDFDLRRGWVSRVLLLMELQYSWPSLQSPNDCRTVFFVATATSSQTTEQPQQTVSCTLHSLQLVICYSYHISMAFT